VLNNLTVNKSGGVTLGANATVNGTLTINSGAFDLNSKTVTGTATVASGGTLRKR
jgi:hypothetical protein